MLSSAKQLLGTIGSLEAEGCPLQGNICNNCIHHHSFWRAEQFPLFKRGKTDFHPPLALLFKINFIVFMTKLKVF